MLSSISLEGRVKVSLSGQFGDMYLSGPLDMEY
jgi:hypothetical protein